MSDFESIRKPKEHKVFILKNQVLLKVFNDFKALGRLASLGWPALAGQKKLKPLFPEGI